jgi:cell division protein FtsB
MNYNNLLRKQVVSEIKKRRLIFLTLSFLVFFYLIISLIFGDMGLIKYMELNKKRAELENQIKQIEIENKNLRSDIRKLKEDPFYMEKHAREDFNLARPDEYIFRYDDR